MAAFPSDNALALVRNDLRNEVKALQAIVANANDWVEALELDRTPLGSADESGFDAARLPIAQSLLSQLRAETSTTSTVALLYRIKSTLGII